MRAMTVEDEGCAECAQNDDLAAMFAGAVHDSMSGTHSHEHAAYGSQGDDSTHAHAHAHDGDNLHRHDHAALAAAGHAGRRPPMAAGSFRITPAQPGALRAAGCPELGGADPMLGAKWALQQDGAYWHVLASGGSQWTTVDSYTEALDAISRQLAETTDTRPVLDQGWKSEMAYEGVSTGDGRKISPGAIQYRNCPMPLMLQTETAGGHQGAVLAGTIDKTGMLGQVALGAGDFDDTDAGKQALQILQARGKFGVSIDVAEAEGQPQCVKAADGGDGHGDSLDECDLGCDWEIVFSMLRVMGLTMTPFPAFEDAYIELAPAAADSGSVAASGTPDVAVPEPLGAIELELVPQGADRAFGTVTPEAFRAGVFGDVHTNGNGNGNGNGTYVLAAPTTTGSVSGTVEVFGGTVEWTTTAEPLAAAGTLATPPAEWFARQGDWDQYLVRQPSGKMALPLTVLDPDPKFGNLRRVFGNVADWSTCHTGIPNRCVTAPKSRTDYAAFNLRPIPTSDGTLVRVGHLTMGCGHATTDPGMAVADVRAHYDGGPGATRMAHVRMGEDQYGPWVAGYIDPAASEAQVRTFASCSLSGDWREVWRGRGLECVAVLAGVTVPGFPIAAAALMAAGVTVPMVPEIGQARIGWRNEQPVALVAAGVIRQPMPWERMLAAQAAEIAELRAENRVLDATVAPLRPLAVAALQASASPGTFAAPTAQDANVAVALLRLLSAAHATMEAQAADPDNDTDPDDAGIRAHLKDIMQTIDAAIVLQAKDGNEDVSQPTAASAEPESETVPRRGFAALL